MRHKTLVMRSTSLLLAVGLAACDEKSSPTPRAITSVLSDWKAVAKADKRKSLAEELIRDRHLIGLSREQVIAALGPPSERTMSPAYGDPKYIVGPSGLDDMWLCIHVEGGKVKLAELRSD